MKNKCPSCSCLMGTGSSSRCLAVEKILESIRITCPYAPNGCRESFNYAEFQRHKASCMYSPCCCPVSDCNFEGSLERLSSHCNTMHRESIIQVELNSPMTISLDRDKPITILHGNNSDYVGAVYILHNNNSKSVGGCFITLTAIYPGIQEGVKYKLIAKCRDSSLQLKASIVSTKHWTGVSPSKDFLLVPHDFFDTTGLLNLNLLITWSDWVSSSSSSPPFVASWVVGMYYESKWNRLPSNDSLKY